MNAPTTYYSEELVRYFNELLFNTYIFNLTTFVRTFSFSFIKEFFGVYLTFTEACVISLVQSSRFAHTLTGDGGLTGLWHDLPSL
jgi:hypothetical protein